MNFHKPHNTWVNPPNVSKLNKLYNFLRTKHVILEIFMWILMFYDTINIIMEKHLLHTFLLDTFFWKIWLIFG